MLTTTFTYPRVFGTITEIAGIDLPKSALQFHEKLKGMTNNFSDWSMYDESEVVGNRDKSIYKHFNLVDAYLWEYFQSNILRDINLNLTEVEDRHLDLIYLKEHAENLINALTQGIEDDMFDPNIAEIDPEKPFSHFGDVEEFTMLFFCHLRKFITYRHAESRLNRPYEEEPKPKKMPILS